MPERNKVGVADAATVKRMNEQNRTDAIAEAKKRLYQPAKKAPAAKPAVDMLRGVDALVNRKKYIAKALKDVGE